MTVLKKIQPRHSDFKMTTGSMGDTPEDYKTIFYKRESVAPTYKKSPPRISLNPFSSDEDEDDNTSLPTTHGSMWVYTHYDNVIKVSIAVNCRSRDLRLETL